MLPFSKTYWDGRKGREEVMAEWGQVFLSVWQKPDACWSIAIIRERRGKASIADLSVQFGIWIVAPVSGPASP